MIEDRTLRGGAADDQDVAISHRAQARVPARPAGGVIAERVEERLHLGHDAVARIRASDKETDIVPARRQHAVLTHPAQRSEAMRNHDS